jgi:hypothetical protein
MRDEKKRKLSRAQRETLEQAITRDLGNIYPAPYHGATQLSIHRALLASDFIQYDAEDHLWTISEAGRLAVQS